MRNIFRAAAVAAIALSAAGCGAQRGDACGAQPAREGGAQPARAGEAAPAAMHYTLDFAPEEHYIDVSLLWEPQGGAQGVRRAKGAPGKGAVCRRAAAKGACGAAGAAGADSGELTLTLPAWAPGYYIIVDYAKYLTGFEACDMLGTPLKWRKQGKGDWVVENHGEPARIKYRIYADERSVAECRVAPDGAFVPGNGVFMYADGETSQSVDVQINMPEYWSTVSTALEPDPQGIYTAPDFDVLYDSPFFCGNQTLRRFEQDGHVYEFALETPEGFDDSPMASDLLKAIKAATAMFGDIPYDRYLFLLMGRGRGGLEHQCCQADYTSGSFVYPTREAYLDELMFFVHEYFHNYNVKAIRPVELGPFDYTRENFTPSLWVSEGFTVYYESRLLQKAGIISEQDHLDFITPYIRQIETNEGRKHMSLRQSSYDIWLNFFNFLDNSDSRRISYYVKGPILGLLFDQWYRAAGRSLDDLMTLLYERFHKGLGRGFGEEEFWQAADEIRPGTAEMLRRWVDTTDEIDYEAVLSPAGITLDRSTWKMTAPAGGVH